MKYIILLGDGMADYPISSLDGKTPLEFARTPNMDRMAAQGTVGLVDTIPAGLPPGSDVANLAILGYDPRQFYSGRGPLEAANMGITVGAEDVAFRCNLVTLGGSTNTQLLDFTAGHIDSATANLIIRDLDEKLGSELFAFYSGVSYRHLFVWRNGRGEMKTTPPHDITGREIGGYYPKGEGAEELRELMLRAGEFLPSHPLNRKRVQEGKKPANAIWLWGQGRAPRIVPLSLKYNLKGGMISAVDLLNGIGIYAGLKVLPVQGATGYIDTNYAGKASTALKALEEFDFVFLHVEAPDEMGHEGNLEGKIRAIEDFDEKIVGPVLDGITKFDAFRVLVVSDHPTPVALMTHGSEPSPFTVYSSAIAENLACGDSFGETAARKSEILISPGHRLMDYFIGDWRRFVEGKSH